MVPGVNPAVMPAASCGMSKEGRDTDITSVRYLVMGEQHFLNRITFTQLYRDFIPLYCSWPRKSSL